MARPRPDYRVVYLEVAWRTASKNSPFLTLIPLVLLSVASKQHNKWYLSSEIFIIRWIHALTWLVGPNIWFSCTGQFTRKRTTRYMNFAGCVVFPDQLRLILILYEAGGILAAPWLSFGMNRAASLNQRHEMFSIFLQRVTVLIGEPMEFAETVEEYRKAKKSAVSWCYK